jgi:hypothetical protein
MTITTETVMVYLTVKLPVDVDDSGRALQRGF